MIVEEKLMHHLRMLGDRLLYVQTATILDAGSPVSTISYRRLGHPEDVKDLLGKAENAEVQGWTWFDPDPIGMGETELESLVQYRHMRPLRIRLGFPENKREDITATLVPWRILDRPGKEDNRWACYGEPWCHRCNETFFWDPGVEEVPSVPNGRGLRCARCRHALPSG